MKNWIHSTVRRFALWLLSWVDDCPTCGCPWRVHRCPYDQKAISKVCGECGIQLPVDAVRFHDGKYFCKDCKRKFVESQASIE